MPDWLGTQGIEAQQNGLDIFIEDILLGIIRNVNVLAIHAG